MSETDILPLVCRSSAFSVLDESREPLVRISIITAMGMRWGMSMCLILSQRVAPSMVAASYSWGSMPVSVAMYRMVFQPAFCQMSDPMNSGRNHSGSMIK